MPTDMVNEPTRLGFHQLENAAEIARKIADHLGLVAMAADALAEDEARIAGPMFYAAATSLEDQMVGLSTELYRLTTVWQQEALAAKSK